MSRKKYTKQTWTDRPSVASPINALRLNHIETGIDDIDNAVVLKASYADIETKTGTSVQFTDADDALIGITAMDGTGSVTVVSMNNNVINPTITSSTVSGVTSTRQVDKSYILNGTATASGGVFILGSTYSGSIVFTLRKGTYVLRGTGTSLLGIYLYKADGTTINTSINNLTFTLSADTDFSSVSLRWFTASTVLNNLRVYPQVSFGSTLTAYEPYKENTLTIPDVTTATYPVYLTSYKGITNVFTLNTGQPTFTAIAKSELWARDYLQDLHIADIKDSNVTFTDAVADGTITSGSKISTIIGLIKYKLSALATAVAGKIDKTSISTTDTENSTTKVAAASVAYALGQEIDAINDNVTFLTPATGWEDYFSQPFLYIKFGKARLISGTIRATTNILANTLTATLPESLEVVRFKLMDSAGNSYFANLNGLNFTIESPVSSGAVIYVTAITRKG